MKAIFRKITIPLCVAAVSGLLAVNARAIEVDPAANTEAKTDAKADCKTETKPETKHGLKIVHRTEAHAGHLAEMLTQHTKKVADKTEEATVHVANRVEKFGHKVGEVVTRTSDKIEKKFDNLFE